MMSIVVICIFNCLSMWIYIMQKNAKSNLLFKDILFANNNSLFINFNEETSIKLIFSKDVSYLLSDKQPWRDHKDYLQ